MNMKTKQEIEALAKEYAKSKSSSPVFAEAHIKDFIAGYTACQDEDRWVPVSQGTVPCYETGNWDGKRSDKLLLLSDDGEHWTGTAYEGFMDGSYFLDFYDKNDYKIKGVTHWQPLPNPPKK